MVVGMKNEGMIDWKKKKKRKRERKRERKKNWKGGIDLTFS